MFKHLITFSLVTLVITLTGCGATSSKPTEEFTSDIISPDLPFKAQGNEPPWQLIISSSQLELLQGYEQQSKVFTAVDLMRAEADKVAVTAGEDKQLTAVLTPSICHDSMSGMPHPWQAEVTLKGKKMQGCGGDPLELLLGEWQIEDINSEGIIDSSHLTMTFNDEGRVFGSASCNNYSSSYELTGEKLTFSHSLATKMACPEALMNQEHKFLTVLNKISHFDIDKTGALILKSQDGDTLRGYLLGQ